MNGNAAALEGFVSEHELDGPVVEMCRSLAQAVDAEPQKAALWREYREALKQLVEVAADGASDERDATIIALRTPLGHAQES